MRVSMVTEAVSFAGDLLNDFGLPIDRGADTEKRRFCVEVAEYRQELRRRSRVRAVVEGEVDFAPKCPPTPMEQRQATTNPWRYPWRFELFEFHGRQVAKPDVNHQEHGENARIFRAIGLLDPFADGFYDMPW